MPVCITCKQEKAESEFWWRWKEKGIRQKVCKACRSKEISQWYDRHHDEHRENVAKRLAAARQAAREYVWDYLTTHPCCQCGETDPVVLEFHHVSEKKETISRLVALGASTQRIEKELGACIVLCANCHRRLTSKERGWFRGN